MVIGPSAVLTVSSGPPRYCDGTAATRNGARSRSTRSLFSGTGAGASIRGGGRFATFFCSSRTTSWRTCFRCLPEASSRRCSKRVCIHSMVCNTHAPSLSMISNQDTPRNSATPASHSPRSSRVAPRKLRPCAMPLPIWSPSTPPAVLGRAAPFQCKVARPQLVASVKMNPAPRSTVLMRERASGNACSLWTSQPAYASITGNK